MTTDVTHPDPRRFERLMQHGARAFRWGYKSVLGQRRQLLIEIAWRLGDEVMALPLFPALRAHFPRDLLGVLTNYPELFVDSPYIDAVNPLWPQADRHVLLRGAPRKVYRLRHLAQRANVAQPESQPSLAYWSLPPAPPGPYVAIAPGASWATKQWPRDHWQTLGKALQGAGHTVIELGLAGESVGVGRDETGNRPLREAARWLRGADLVVCLDSGLMHLALALGTPVLALYGPTDPSLYVRDHPLFHVVDNGRSCRACWNRGRMTQPGACPLHIAHCLDTIAPAEVLRGVEALIPRQVNRCASSF